MDIQSKHLRVLGKIVSNDLARPVLTGIHVKNTLVEATDGYIAGWYKEPPTEDMIKEIILPSDKVKLAAKTKHQAIGVRDNQLITFDSGVYPFQPIKGDFPAVDTLLEGVKKKKYLVNLTLNPKLLKKLCEAAILEDEVMITFTIPAGGVERINEGKSRIDRPDQVLSAVPYKVGDLTGLIMPVRRAVK
jgi:hypothetical protein